MTTAKKLLSPWHTALDQKTLTELYENDLDYALSMFETFCEIMPEEMRQLNHAIESQNTSDIHNISHKIKSNFTMVGLLALYEITAQIEQLSRDESHMENILSLYKKLDEAIQIGMPIVQSEARRLRTLSQ